MACARAHCMEDSEDYSCNEQLSEVQDETPHKKRSPSIDDSKIYCEVKGIHAYVEQTHTNEKCKRKITNMLLLGLTGHGKSATGNSILEYKHFVSRGGNESVTKECATGFRFYNDSFTQVVDTPGIEDTREFTESRQNELLLDALTESFTACPLGYHAILLVLSYSQRIQKESLRYLHMWIRLIGKEQFASHGIIVMTNADAFHRDHGTAMSCDQWWEESHEDIKPLYEYCGKRCFLLENFPRDKSMKIKQLKALQTKIEENAKHNAGTCVPILFNGTDGDKAMMAQIAGLRLCLDMFCILYAQLKEINATDYIILNDIKSHVDNLINMLTADEYSEVANKIGDANMIELKQFQQMITSENFDSLPTASSDLCKLIESNIKPFLTEMIKSSIYWQKTKKKIKYFFGYVAPTLAGSIAIIIGGGVFMTGMSCVAAPVAVTRIGLCAVTGVIANHLVKEHK